MKRQPERYRLAKEDLRMCLAMLRFAKGQTRTAVSLIGDGDVIYVQYASAFRQGIQSLHFSVYPIYSEICSQSLGMTNEEIDEMEDENSMDGCQKVLDPFCGKFYL